MDRRHFITSSALGIPLLGSSSLFAQDTAKPARPTALPAELVQEFVRVGHGEFDAVKRMLDEQPALLNTSHDWGGGDFETALEAAGHVGSREVAEFLLARGARANIFVLTMLGHTTIVKGLLSLYPHLLRSKGPHGFSLLHHAARGGEPAKELLEHIHELGLTEMKLPMP